jgi:hypothetical protein
MGVGRASCCRDGQYDVACLLVDSPNTWPGKRGSFSSCLRGRYVLSSDLQMAAQRWKIEYLQSVLINDASFSK